VTWTRRAAPIQIGDLVAYSAAWLRSTGQFAGDIAHAKGTVIELNTLSPEVTLATIEWDKPDIPPKVITQNLCRVNERGFSA